MKDCECSGIFKMLKRSGTPGATYNRPGSLTKSYASATCDPVFLSKVQIEKRMQYTFYFMKKCEVSTPTVKMNE